MTVQASGGAPGARGRGEIPVLAWQLAVLISMLLAWEVAGRYTSSSWVSTPTAVLTSLVALAGGELWPHIGITLLEMGIGLLLGVLAGSLAGLWLGRSPALAAVLRPLILVAYSVPLIALAPLLILWFGIDLAPKVLLVSLLVFFILFFSTMAGVKEIDADLVATVRLMGAGEAEVFRKLILPASMAWIASGIKAALPYALIGSILGEMLASRSGIGHLLTRAASQFDMAGMYACFVVLMVIGTLMNLLFRHLERRALWWRNAGAEQ
jgi:NitT/TauT family transport system permease protein